MRIITENLNVTWGKFNDMHYIMIKNLKYIPHTTFSDPFLMSNSINNKIMYKIL